MIYSKGHNQELFFQLYVIKFSSFYDFLFVCVGKLVLYVHIYHILQTITIRHTILGCGWGGGGGVGVYSKKKLLYTRVGVYSCIQLKSYTPNIIITSPFAIHFYY